MTSRECRPVSADEKKASAEGYYAFDPEKNSDDLNPYPIGSRERDMFSVGWAWANDRWLDE